MNNQLHLSWKINCQKIVMYPDESFIISDKHFHVYYLSYKGWKTSPLTTIKDFAEY